MPTFIKSTCLFIVLFLGLVLFIEISTSFIERKYSNFRLDSEPEIVVFGHSHPEVAFNDSLISNLRNLAQSGESYFYTYFKAKRVLEQNPSIKVVFIGYTNNQIDEIADNWIWGDMDMSLRYPEYSSFMSFKDKFLLMHKNFKAYLNCFSLSVNRRLVKLRMQDFNFTNDIGGYLYLVRDKTDSLLNVKSGFEKESTDSPQGMSEFNVYYLSKLVELCTKQGKRVVLFRSPLHERYEGFQNEARYQGILEKRFGNVEFMDFSKFPLSNSDFGDLEHLNHKGAKKFSEWFAGLLRNELLGKADIRTFVADEMKMRRDSINLKSK